jgi:hypothetical protein
MGRRVSKLGFVRLRQPGATLPLGVYGTTGYIHSTVSKIDPGPNLFFTHSHVD